MNRCGAALLVLEKQSADASRCGRVEIEGRLRQIHAAMEDLVKRNELNGPVYEDLVRLKHLHNRYRHAIGSASTAFG